MSAPLLAFITFLLLGSEPAAVGGGDSTPSGAARSQTDDHVDDDDHDHDHEHQEGFEHHEGEDDIHAFHAHETVVVTGSSIESPAIDLPYAVSVLDRDLLREQGSPLAIDLFKNLTANGAVIGEAFSGFNGLGFGVAENVANVNLRSLGASRTLVLVNNRRQAPIPARLFGGRFVDVNMIPSIAVERIEVLKEGAAAIYGSDAVAGVANFVTRDNFDGFEVILSHEYFEGAGDSMAGFIWGRDLGSSHVVLALERAHRSQLSVAERPFALRPRTETPWGWSNTGNPGAFLVPNLTGDETAQEFVDALSLAQSGNVGRDYFVDPACSGMGGFDRGFTCAFRYQPWSGSLIEKMAHTRLFAELHGPIDERTEYRIEAMFSDVAVPRVPNSPSFPPTSLFDGLHLVSNAHPGRADFCDDSYASGGFSSTEACLQGDWFFFGRTVGNAGPSRNVRRDTDMARLAASVDRDLTLAGRAAKLDLGVAWSRSAGNMNLPAEYSYRKFLAFRGYGGPNCGVGVIADPTAPTGMRLGPTGGAQPGVGDCGYYNPFGSAVEFSAQPGAPWRETPNPFYRPGLANDPAMMAWLGDVADLDNEVELFVADATLSGNWIEDRVDYALGYQFRRLEAQALPNDPANYEINPCIVPGDRSCVDPRTGRQTGARAGQFTFATGYYPYEASQAVHRVFGELSLDIGDRGDMQVAANYELHDEVSSFDPKLSARWRLSEGDRHVLSLRGSVQTTFRAPSLDDLNENALTALEFVPPVGAYRPFDTSGSPDLSPEQALTYDIGLVLFASPGFDMTLDYWSYDIEDVIAREPASNIVRLYGEGRGLDPDPSRIVDPVKLAAVRNNIVCPGGLADASCLPGEVERILLRVINWPGVETSGLDFHLHGGMPAGNGAFAVSASGSYLLEYELKPLVREGVEYVSGGDVAGLFNQNVQAAPSLPEFRSRVSAGYHWADYGLVAYLNHISSYRDANPRTNVPYIGDFLTADLTFLWKFPNLGFDVALSALNLTDEEPPWADFERAFDALIHNAKGRRLKAVLTYRLGA